MKPMTSVPKYALFLALVTSSTFAGATAFFDAPLTVIAHRGGADLRPESTVLAFGHAATLDPNLIFEMDVRMTSDGELVLMHDITVDRTTNGNGPVSSFTFAQLRALDAGHDFSVDGGLTHPYRGMGLQVATLDEVLMSFPDRRMLIEVKVEAGTAAVRPTIDLIRARGMQDRVAIASFDENQVAIMRSYAPEIPTLYSEASATALVVGLQTGTFTPSLLVDDILELPVDVVTGGIVSDSALAFIRQTLGIPILVDTINDEATMRAFLAKPIDGIITDRPDLLLEITRPVPEPSTVWMMAAGLGGGALFLRRRRSAMHSG